MLYEEKEGMQCTLVKFFVHKAAWLYFTAVNADRPTMKTPRFDYAVISESKKARCGMLTISNFKHFMC